MGIMGEMRRMIWWGMWLLGPYAGGDEIHLWHQFGGEFRCEKLENRLAPDFGDYKDGICDQKYKKYDRYKTYEGYKKYNRYNKYDQYRTYDTSDSLLWHQDQCSQEVWPPLVHTWMMPSSSSTYIWVMLKSWWWWWSSSSSFYYYQIIQAKQLRLANPTLWTGWHWVQIC